jgi:hypothetical protein
LGEVYRPAAPGDVRARIAPLGTAVDVTAGRGSTAAGEHEGDAGGDV